jgi:hypothetical protein
MKKQSPYLRVDYVALNFEFLVALRACLDLSPLFRKPDEQEAIMWHCSWPSPEDAATFTSGADLNGQHNTTWIDFGSTES